MNLARKERLAVRDDTSDPHETRDPDHIWLRQSVTFAVNGQTRTLEMALPLRPGATPEEVDALLDEADAGMRRLSQRLDAHLGEITGAPSAVAAPATVAATVAAPAPTPDAAPARMPEATPASQPAARPAAPSAAPSAPQPTIAERPASRPASPAASAPASSARPVAPTVPTGGASSGPDLTRAEFLVAAGTLGLDARTVMERLNVRSLNGLNLREALDLLRRQLVREGAADVEPPAAAPAPVAAAPPTTPDELPAPIGTSRFDEEDDSTEFELSYPDPEDLPSDDYFAGEDDFSAFETTPEATSEATSKATPARPAPSAAPSGPLSDVPDLDDLLGSPTTAATPPAAPTTPKEEEEAVDPATAHVRGLIAGLRAAHPGGQPTEQQRRAYRNIVIDQLGETKAASVARAVWNLTADKLGPEQFDALIRWGKEDAFAEEVEDVLALLRAEWLAQQAAQSGAGQAPSTPSTPSTPSAPAPQPAERPTSRPAPRGRSAAQRTSGASGPANSDSPTSGSAPRDGARQRGGA